MKLQRLLSYVRQAADCYNMIEENDCIAVGVSGGKDSLALLIALKHLQRFYPAHFQLKAISVNIGFEGMDFSPVKKLCTELEIPYNIVKTQIGEIVFDLRKEKNPCSLCAKMRKGALHQAAEEMGCNKVALGHNRDDVIETMLMALFYEGRLGCFSPVTYLDRSKLVSIRPLIYVPEKEVKGFINRNNIEIVVNKCPNDGYSKRAEIKKMISKFREDFDHFDEKVFGAIERSGFEGWRNKNGI